MWSVVYFASVFGALKTLFVIMAVVMFIISIISACAAIGYPNDPDVDKTKKCAKNGFRIACVSLLLSIFTPDKQTYLTMIGVDALESVVKNDKVQEIGGKTLDLVNQYLDKHLDNNQ